MGTFAWPATVPSWVVPFAGWLWPQVDSCNSSFPWDSYFVYKTRTNGNNDNIPVRLNTSREHVYAALSKALIIQYADIFIALNHTVLVSQALFQCESASAVLVYWLRISRIRLSSLYPPEPLPVLSSLSSSSTSSSLSQVRYFYSSFLHLTNIAWVFSVYHVCCEHWPLLAHHTVLFTLYFLWSSRAFYVGLTTPSGLTWFQRAAPVHTAALQS